MAVDRAPSGAGQPSEEAVKALAMTAFCFCRCSLAGGPDLRAMEDGREALKVAYAIDFPAASLDGGKAESELKKALVEAVIPLEVIAGQQRVSPYRELSPGFLDQVEASIEAVRAALSTPEEQT